VLAACHGLTVEAWAELLAWLLPQEYVEPPPPARWSAVQTRRARVALYTIRAAVDTRTRRPAAATALFGGVVDPGDVDDLGRQASRCRNGAVNPQEALRPSEAPGPGADGPGDGGPLDSGWEALAPLRGRNCAMWADRGRRRGGILST
jgi:hypothetical protein